MPESKSIKVMIVEDHPLFSKGLVSLIAGSARSGYNVVGEAANRSDAMKIARQEKPALAIVDISLGEENGLDLIPQLKSLDPDMVILVLSAHDERYYSERVLRLGARGYIMKTEQPPKVLEAIKTVMAGKMYLSDSEQERIFEARTGESRRGVKDWAGSMRKLSDREFQVFSCMGKGMGTVEIADKFKLSAKTIDTHKEHIKLKLQCDSSHDLKRLAIEWGNHPDLPRQ
ncbi:MAG: response regulator transcription factor [Treponema sp.]|jgi:DNA-binding NarL/FixJ family response regulator|nr:response regulator transcription factor [Treponema sp.]